MSKRNIENDYYESKPMSASAGFALGAAVGGAAALLVIVMNPSLVSWLSTKLGLKAAFVRWLHSTPEFRAMQAAMMNANQASLPNEVGGRGIGGV
jgi:hypothetical protein